MFTFLIICVIATAIFLELVLRVDRHSLALIFIFIFSLCGLIEAKDKLDNKDKKTVLFTEKFHLWSMFVLLIASTLGILLTGGM